ncbi:MAG TPA: pyrroloquinoline quinone biosynthesis protein PqqB [Opitutaceae bacterium]|jgi:pyrroloquinoline quinone biosynthesis protein B|nr:pyrroloquinoline quinone biosynthesis protein PqqB [Opitutaceae bacterium]
MRIILLGTAAGGGLPQWNCNCANCREVRTGSAHITARTQSSVAISADGVRWFLLNASPDLRGQMENFAPLHPRPKTRRSTPVEAVLLTNADLDHTLGLLLLREGGPLPVHATPRVRRTLTRDISIDPVLKAFCGVRWIAPPRRLAPLLDRAGKKSGLLYEAVELPGKPPRFARGGRGVQSGHCIGYRILDEKTGGCLMFFPDVAAIDDRTASLLGACDALLFDGTFWSEDEMQQAGVGHTPAKKMGHMPIAGRTGSLKRLAALTSVRHKIYVHLNNTNPILRKNSPEHAAVRAAGLKVGSDGMEITI